MTKLVLLFSVFSLLAQDAEQLPVKRVVLYKNGVGYFEHLGRVRDNQDIAVRFTSGQLNDVLKSLTVLDLNGGRIAGVTYGSVAPISRRLGDLNLPVADKASLTEFLGALRGAKLEIRNGAQVTTGRLLSIERKTRMGGGATLEVDYLSVITDAGEIKTAEVTPAFSVRLLEPGLTGKVGRYMDLMSASREADLRQMVVSTAGAGERSVFVSYISEVPVWKTTYRLVLSAKAPPLLQGWAIVDNTVGEDWEKVDLSLVAGAPQSFIQKLSQPYYARRPEVPLPEAYAAMPQTFEATLALGGARVAGVIVDASGAVIANARIRAKDANGGVIAEGSTNSEGRYELGGLPDGKIQLEVDSSGFRRQVIPELAVANGRTTNYSTALEVGGVSETMTVTAEAARVNTANASMLLSRNNSGSGRSLGSGNSLGAQIVGNGLRNATPAAAQFPMSGLSAARAQLQSAAQGQDLGDLFEYKLKEPITIRKNQSALVPIVQSSVEAEKVSVWSVNAATPRPLRALWIRNSSALTLDGGSFSVLESETFAGEGLLDPIRPGERRLASYAVDLALNASSRQESEQQRVTRVRAAKGVLICENEVRERTSYVFRNEDTAARAVIVEHPARPGYALRGDAKPEETTRSTHRFRLAVNPKQTATLVVEEARPLETTYQINELTGEQIAAFVRARTFTPEMEATLRKVLAQKQVVADLESRKEAREAERSRIFDNQQRLRENLKALKGSAEEKALVQRYTQQLSSEEDRLEKLSKEIEDLAAKIEKAEEELDLIVQAAAFDSKV